MFGWVRLGWDEPSSSQDELRWIKPSVGQTKFDWVEHMSRWV